MRILFFLLQKEFLQVFRDPAILRLIFLMPVMQLIVLPIAADYEIKNIKLAVVDHDHSPYSRHLIEKFTASGYFQLTNYAASYSEGLSSVERDEADLILQIPQNFEKDLVKEDKSKVFLAVNAVNGAKGGLAGGYSAAVVREFNANVRLEWVQFPRMMPMPMIETQVSHWFNPSMSYPIFMVPGILVILVTMVGAFLSALNIVREKEIGTIEQLNVTPIKKWQFVLGKLIPFWFLGLLVMMIGMGVGRIVFGIVPTGSLPAILTFASVYLLCVLGIGLLISTYSQTQQQAMFLAFFFLMIFILMGGLYTSIDSMPIWAKNVSRFNPAAYFIEVMRMIVLKGSGFADIWKQLLIVFGFALFFNSWAIWNYRKTV